MMIAGAAEPDGAGEHGVTEMTLHAFEILGRTRLVEGAVPHGPGPQRRVADVGGAVDHLRERIDGTEVLGERLPLPVNAGRHRFAVDVLGPLEVAHDEVLLISAGWRQREAAVAHDDSGDAVPRRAARHWVPEQ